MDVEPCDCYRQQADRSENRETAANVVGNDISLITFLGCKAAERAAACVCYCNDTLRRFLASELMLELIFEQTESYRRLGSRTLFRDYDYSEFLIFQIV